MSKSRITLQHRIITLIVISSVLFISAFTLIQINSQLNAINRANAAQFNIATVIAKNNLEATIRQSSPDKINEHLTNDLIQLKDIGLISDAIIFDTEGVVITAIGDYLTHPNLSNHDLNAVAELENLKGENKWFLVGGSSAAQRMDIFLSLHLDSKGPLMYVTKLSFHIKNIQEALTDIYQQVAIAAVIIILANILFGYFLSKTVIGPVRILNEVTKIIAKGDLTVRARIDTNDELAELGSTFNHMTEELLIMKERAENSNPLTKLPGNIMIHDEVENKIRLNEKFLVIYSDLDNFKSFNDKYGIAKGDDAIKLTAEILKEAVKIKGNPSDFLGHEGGDDFFLLTTPDKGQAIADHIILEFNRQVRSLYNAEDLALGHIIAHARDGAIKQFPIMTISLAGVTNEHRDITSYGQVTNIAAECKHKAKEIGQSVFILDKRKN